MHNIGLVHAIASTDSDYWALVQHPCLLVDPSANSLKAHIAVDEYSDFCNGPSV